jgi:hypothetical protein
VKGVDSDACDEQMLCADGTCSLRPACCRPDGHCGLVVPVLGCVAREKITEGAGGPFPKVECTHACVDDNDCDGSNPTFICTEAVGGSDRFCAAACASDSACPTDEVCAIANDDADNQIDAYCQTPIGESLANEHCGSAEDCTSGICIQAQQVCSALCEADDDCPGAGSSCMSARISLPDGSGTQTLEICL